jgi:hypothetical protein
MSATLDGLFSALSAVIMQCDITKCFDVFVNVEVDSNASLGIVLSKDDCNLLFAEYPNASPFLAKIMCDDLDQKTIIQVVCHLCLECIEYSECIIAQLVRAKYINS